MVTDRERDYLWDHYAADRRARINLGIRRRLAPLMENDRRKIELLKGLLLSMPGTPVLYYGDEIGMGDNVFLGDRDGVRTPMQWSFDRNGGFSRADPAQPLSAADHGSGLRVRGGQCRGAEPLALLAAELDQAADRGAPHAPGARARHAAVPLSGQPQGHRLSARMGRRDDPRASPICRARPRRSNSTCRSFAAATSSRCWAAAIFPQIGEQPYLLTLQGYSFFWFELVAAGGAGEQQLDCRRRRRNSSRWSCRRAGAICSAGTICRSSNAR